MNEKTETVNGFVYRYSSSWIHQLEREEHWRLYWQQQKLMQDLVSAGDHVLEIGVGSGFTANYLRSKGVKVTTIDIDADKKPDIVANIVTYDFKQTYDHILAFEVFEHIPYEEVEKLFSRLSKVCRKNLFMSVPKNEVRLFRAEFWLPLIGHRILELTIRKFKITEPNHHWEVDWKKVSLKRFNLLLQQSGF